MTQERDRLWRLFNEHQARGIPPGSIYVPAMIMTSGHSFDLVRRSQDYSYVVKEVDPRLDDIEYVREMYQSAGVTCPRKPKLSWNLSFLDLGVLDSSSNTFFVLRYGPN